MTVLQPSDYDSCFFLDVCLKICTIVLESQTGVESIKFLFSSSRTEVKPEILLAEKSWIIQIGLPMILK